MSMIQHHAEAFARERHAGQFRKGAAREPYVVHLEEVAGIVAAAGGDDIAVASAWLHDAVEDVGVTFKELEVRFGTEVAAIVRELTDDKSLPKGERKRLQVENAPKKSTRAAMIKIADKTSNLRAIASSPPVDWSAETKRAYAAQAAEVISGLPSLPEALHEFFRAAHAAVVAQ